MHIKPANNCNRKTQISWKQRS